MASSPRFSYSAMACLMLAVISYFRADLAFTNGAFGTDTNLHYVTSIFRLIPKTPRPPGFWPASPISEERLMVGLVLLSLLFAVAAIAFTVKARRRNEAPTMYAGIAALSVGVAVLATRFILFLWPIFI